MTSLPDRQHTVDLVSEAQSNGARLEYACELLNISVRTYQRWYRDGKVEADNRPTAIRPEPSNKLTPEEQETVLALCNEPEYRSCPPGFIVADLLDQGHYLASESTIYRLLRAANQQHHRGREKVPTPKRQATSHKAQAPNELWSWDISWLPGPVKGQWFYLYLMVDLFSRKIVGHEVYESETGELASEFVQKAYWRERLAAQPKPLVLHSDNGSPMKAAIFQEKLYDLGIVPSRSRPRVSNDNAFSEALFRTLKYRPGFPAKGFATLEQARQWVLQFTHWYNNEHRHSALNYVTPAQRHNGEAESVLASRQKVLSKAKSTTPERWSGALRDLSLPGTVTLNPERAANC